MKHWEGYGKSERWWLTVRKMVDSDKDGWINEEEFLRGMYYIDDLVQKSA
jgi:hypothetical protein